MIILLCICFSWSTFWTALSAIGTIAMTIVTYCSLKDNRKSLADIKQQREDEMRARIECSIIKDKLGYFLKISNVGKEGAFNINIDVSGKPIDNTLYDFVKETFENLKSQKFALTPGDNKFFYISPHIINDDRDITKLPWKQKYSRVDINNWLKQHDTEMISIVGTYNDRYYISFHHSIREFNILGSFQLHEQLSPIK